ncbi:MAG: glycosyltransferase [Candidatus Eisenbacteria bacterium]|nr:glycosyltransferase [Candidatus Eisenbacteria bacterium]
MDLLQNLLVGLYGLASLGLFVYGLNCYLLIALFLRHRGEAERRTRAVAADYWRRSPELPRVTTQLPLWNERFVAERLIRSVAALDWPRDRHQIQVLDDSTDETRELCASLCAELRAAGIDIVHLHRTNRDGWKAGALNQGLAAATGEFVAIFDADFIPDPDFLRRTIPQFDQPGPQVDQPGPHFRAPGPRSGSGRIAMVQTRWGHVNRTHSLLTRAQAIGIDGHFVIEQGARTWHGLFMNFNGTAGVWRAEAIRDAGGWTSDTLTEDLDLSYRAQLRGWRMRYLHDVVTPSELPIDINGLKSQQHRWAKGSIQVACKLLPAVFRAPVSLGTKIQAWFHLTHYLIHPMIVLVALLAWPALLWFTRVRLADALVWSSGALLGLSTVAPSVLYLCSQRSTYRDWIPRVLILPALIVIGIGIAVNNTRAVLEAVLRRESAFIRTPKYGVVPGQGGGGSAAPLAQRRRTYGVKWHLGGAIELALGLYGIWTLWLYVEAGKWVATPLLTLNALGFTAVGLLSLAHAWRWRPRPAA